MSESLYFDYYYGDEAEQFQFVKIPKNLLKDSMFQDLSFGAIITFAVLLDRNGLSKKNNWFDEYNRVYIRYKISDLTEVMGKSEDRISKYLKELEDIGLIERSRKGLGEGKVTYVKNFISPILREQALITRENAGNGELKNYSNFDKNAQNDENDSETNLLKASKIHITRENAGNVPRENAVNVTRESAVNITRENAAYSNTENSNIYINNTKRPYPNHIVSTGNQLENACDDDWIRCREMIRSNIEYDYYSSSMKRHDLEEINGIVDIMTEILISRMPSFWIAGAEYPAGMVKDRMLRITSQHIDYVLECFHKSTVKIYNIKKYLLASLFNATSTIDSYYRNDANHDLYGID